MHIRHQCMGIFKRFLMTAWMLLTWFSLSAAWAANSVAVTATPSSGVAPANITLSVTVTADPDPVTVTRVEYVNGNTRISESTNAPFSLNLANLGPGSYVFKAYATLAAPQSTVLVSAPVALTVTGGTAASAAVYYIHTDQLNTPRVIADHNQAVVWKWESDGFGLMPPNEQPGAAGAFEFNPRFAGQYFDRESNLHYNYYRDYDPQTGRYAQSDPIGLGGGINTYAYVGSNPLSYVDLNGLEKIILLPPSDANYQAALNSPDIAGALIVISHGSRLTVNGMDAKALERFLRKRGWNPKKTPVILDACDTGKGPGSIGDQLGRNTGGAVIAPSDKTWTTPWDGNLEKPYPPMSQDRESTWNGIPNLSRPGTWNLFTAGGQVTR